jgi:hypothetical protein
MLAALRASARASPKTWTRGHGARQCGGLPAALGSPSDGRLLTSAARRRWRAWSRRKNRVVARWTEEQHYLGEVDARSLLLERPQRFGSTDDRGGRDRPKVAAVE